MRLMLKRPLSDLFLDLEAPIKSISVTTSLNAPGDVSATLPIEYFARKGEDGVRVLEEYGCLLIVEDDAERIIQVALLDDVRLDEDSVSISGGGLSMQARDTPWRGEDKVYEEANTVDIFKDVWDHILSYNHSADIKITGDTESTGTLGVSDSPEYATLATEIEEIKARKAIRDKALLDAEEDLKAKTSALFKATGLKTIGQVRVSNGAPTATKNVVWLESDQGNRPQIYKGSKWSVVSSAQSAANAYISSLAGRDKAKADATNARDYLRDHESELSEISDQEGESYDVTWYSVHNLQSVIDDCVEAGPFDYVERSRWSGESLVNEIYIGSPRIGSRREDLIFELGMNVVSQPTLDVKDPYTGVVVFGSGEGSATLITDRWIDDPVRVRRVKVLTDKDAVSKELVAKTADRELRAIKTSTGFELDSITVIDHPFARNGTYSIGDEIRVTGDLPDGSDLDLWVRITDITKSDDQDTSELRVETV